MRLFPYVAALGVVARSGRVVGGAMQPAERRLPRFHAYGYDVRRNDQVTASGCTLTHT